MSTVSFLIVSINNYDLIALGSVLGWLFYLLYAARRLAYYLQMAQQTSYRPERYWRWLFPRFGSEIFWLDSLAVLALLLATAYNIGWLPLPQLRTDWQMWLFIALPPLLALLPLLFWRRPPVKKPLVWTARAKRLYAAALLPWALLLAVQPVCTFALDVECYWAPLNAVLASSLPLQMWLAVAGRQPFEEARNRKFVADAAKIIRESPNLLRIGITGSYGKTSSKMLIGRVLAESKYTLVTPDSYNTPMGITLTIRQQLKPIHQVFVAEMGARQKGDIKELCELVQPEIGVLTSIGPQHLETFGNIETVADTKFELIDSLPSYGLAVLNLDDPLIAARLPELKMVCRTYAVDRTDADYTASDVSFSPQGMDFVLHTAEGGSQPIHTRLLGKHNISNILAAAAVGEYLGLGLAEIARAVAQTPPVEHRLVLKPAGGFTIIDDAFNANPQGSKAAVDVLAAMPGGRKMIITPGMVELGSEQERLNREFARYCAQKLDYVLIVGQKQSAPLLAGLREAGLAPERWRVAADLAEASAFMRGWVRPGDYVLFENDLPDNYL